MIRLDYDVIHSLRSYDTPSKQSTSKIIIDRSSAGPIVSLPCRRSRSTAIVSRRRKTRATRRVSRTKPRRRPRRRRRRRRPPRPRSRKSRLRFRFRFFRLRVSLTGKRRSRLPPPSPPRVRDAVSPPPRALASRPLRARSLRCQQRRAPRLAPRGRATRKPRLPGVSPGFRLRRRRRRAPLAAPRATAPPPRKGEASRCAGAAPFSSAPLFPSST